MKILRSNAVLGAVVGLCLCGTPAYAQHAAGPDDTRQATHFQPDAPPADGLDLRGYVSTDLDPAEQEFMRSQMNQLPRRMKEKFLRTDLSRVSISIVDGATGAVHYNRPELQGDLRREEPRPLPGDDYPGDVQAGPDERADVTSGLTSCGSSPSPGCTAGGGPYRRVFTPPVAAEVTCPSGVTRPCNESNGTNNGYWNAGTVTTSCNTGIFASRGGGVSDVGYAFLGGYSASPTATGGIVNGGLQDNDELFTGHPKENNYALFLGIKGVEKLVFESSNPPGDAPPRLIDCGGKTTLEFRVAPWELNLNTRAGCTSSKTVDYPNLLAACGTVAFIIERGTGGAGEQTAEQVIIWLAPSVTYGGWGVNATSNQGTTEKPVKNYWPQVPCGGCIFKWTTGIGQLNEDLEDNSSYSVTWSDREIAPWATDPGDKSYVDYGVPVPMTEKLTRCTEYPLWTVYDGATVEADCSNTPLHVSGVKGDVKVSGYSVSGETDDITLSP